MGINELFGEKYKEAITEKQKSLNEYQLALQNLKEAFKKRNHLNESSELSNNMIQAFQKLQDLQFKKRDLNVQPFTSTQINFTNNLSQTIEEPPPTSSEQPIKEKPNTSATIQKEKEEKEKIKIHIKNDAPIPSPWNSPLIKSKKKK